MIFSTLFPQSYNKYQSICYLNFLSSIMNFNRSFQTVILHGLFRQQRVLGMKSLEILPKCNEKLDTLQYLKFITYH
jgi:hypothetical protein